MIGVFLHVYLMLTNLLSACVCVVFGVSAATRVDDVFVAVCCCGSGVGSGRLNRE